MKIKVTDIDTGTVTIYDYSKDNWRRRYACMQDGAIHCWAPAQCAVGVIIKTSGRLWEVLRNA